MKYLREKKCKKDNTGCLPNRRHWEVRRQCRRKTYQHFTPSDLEPCGCICCGLCLTTTSRESGRKVRGGWWETNGGLHSLLPFLTLLSQPASQGSLPRRPETLSHTQEPVCSHLPSEAEPAQGWCSPVLLLDPHTLWRPYGCTLTCQVKQKMLFVLQ